MLDDAQKALRAINKHFREEHGAERVYTIRQAVRLHEHLHERKKMVIDHKHEPRGEEETELEYVERIGEETKEPRRKRKAVSPEGRKAAKERSVYQEARRSLSQHMHRHHGGAWATGTLAERLELHDELHTVAKRLGRPMTHSHKPWREDETLEQVAFRYLEEGNEHYGQTDVTTDS